MRRHILVLTAVLAAANVGLQAQTASLADVARAEESRRKAVKASGKVYTNEDLKRSGNETPRAPAPVATPSAPAAKPEPAATQKPAGELRDEKYWRERMAVPQQALARSKVLFDALQSRINALNTDFTNRDDPAQRTIIDVNRQSAIAEMQRLTREIENLNKEILTIQEEARKAGVPAGWLR